MTLTCRSHTVRYTHCTSSALRSLPTKMGNVKPHTHIQFIDFIFNAVFFYAPFSALFSYCCRLNTTSTLCRSVCLCSMPLKALSTIISMAQDIFDFVCIAIQRLVVQAFTNSMAVYSIQCGSGSGSNSDSIRSTMYLPFIHSLCMLKHQKHNVLNSSSVYIRNRVYFRYEAALLYRLPSNPCDFYFFRFLAFLIFCICWPFQWRCADAQTEKDSANDKRKNWEKQNETERFVS